MATDSVSVAEAHRRDYSRYWPAPPKAALLLTPLTDTQLHEQYDINIILSHWV